MKKLLLICLAILPLFFLSCEKHKNSDELAGTTWMTSGFSSIMGPMFNTYDNYYKFNGDGTGVEWWTNKNGAKVDMEDITYSYDYPNLIIYDSDGDATNHIFISKYKFCTVAKDGTPNKSITYNKQ